jgi:hypothetical protein
MPKSRKKAAAPDAPIMPQVGDRVTKPRSESVLEITHVSHDGDEVNLNLPGTNLEWFRVKTDTLTFVERRPSPGKSSAKPSTLDTAGVMKRIAVVQRESLQRLDDDIDILKTYLKTQRAPKATIEALEGLTIDQHKSWKATIDRIKDLLEE